LKGIPEPSCSGSGLRHGRKERESDLEGQNEPIFVPGGLVKLAVVAISAIVGFWIASSFWGWVL
jgi:hypothetical protein